MRLRRRPGILIDHQPVDSHRAFGEPNGLDAKPAPARYLQADLVEQPADVRDGTGPVAPAPRPRPAGPPADDARAGWRQPRRFDAGPRLCQASARTPEAGRLVV